MPSWVDPDVHAWVHHPSGVADWQVLLDRYGASAASPLAQIFKVARAHRCRTVVEENRYVDSDFRSEYSAFWSQRFPSTSPFSRRLHFFRRKIVDRDLHAIDGGRDGYVGYSCLRPLSQARVGRTVLSPPPRLKGATLALATDRVSLFGAELTVRGAPFTEQDGEFLRCAHAAAWMCHYSGARRGLVGRQLTTRLVDSSPTTTSADRPLPSPGLTLNQLQAIFGATGQPALFYGLGLMPRVRGVPDPAPEYDARGRMKPPGLWDTRVFSVLCRYLNSGFPVLVGTHNHAFVVVGWYREGTKLRYIVCDDQRGPYEVVNSPFTDGRGPWVSLMVPLPPKVYLSGETAESAAYTSVQSYGTLNVPAWQLLSSDLANGNLSLRTSLRSNADFKARVTSQGRGGDAARILRLARLPHWIWVVEVLDRALRVAGKPAVRAEFIFDSTSSDRAPLAYA